MILGGAVHLFSKTNGPAMFNHLPRDSCRADVRTSPGNYGSDADNQPCADPNSNMQWPKYILYPPARKAGSADKQTLVLHQQQASQPPYQLAPGKVIGKPHGAAVGAG